MPGSAFTRGTFLKRAGAAGIAVAGGTLWATSPAARAARIRRVDTPIDHLVIACQVNRSYDHYFGMALGPGAFGPSSGYTQPDGQGGNFAPFEFTALSTPDIPHSWDAVHAQWDGGAMDGFYTTDGANGMGFYTKSELPFYYSLLDNSALNANYFCSLLGPTWPNRFYFAAGTSGGITTNGIWGYGVFDYPIILDLLDAAGVSWGVYNMNWDSVPFGNTDNVFVFCRSSPTTSAPAAARARSSTTPAREPCPRSPGSCRASPTTRTSILRPTSPSAWACSRS